MRKFGKHLPLLFLAGFAAAFLIIWRRLFFEGKVPLNGDTFRFFYPSWEIGRSLIKEGGFFLWDPFRNMGQPFLASPQNLALYPLRLLFPFLSYVRFQQVSILFHVAVAGLFSYLLARHWFKDRGAALLAAVGMSFNGYFFSRAGYPSDFMTMAWLPCVVYCLTTERRTGLVISLLMMWLAGFPPFFLMTVLFLLVYCAVSPHPRKYFSHFIFGGIMAAGLSAVQSLPFLELVKESYQGVLNIKGEVNLFSLTPAFGFKHLLYPSFFLHSFTDRDYSMTRFYIGPILLVLGCLGAWRGKKLARTLALTGWIGFFLSFGKWIDFFRFPSRWLFLFTFGCVFSGAAGISKFKNTYLKWGLVGVVLIDLMAFSFPVYGMWANAKFLNDNPNRIKELDQANPAGRLFHSNNILSTAYRWDWLDPAVWQFSKEALIPSYGTAFRWKETFSHANLISARNYFFNERLNRTPLESPLFDYANVSVFVGFVKEGARAIINPNPQPHAFMEKGLSSVVVAEDKPGDILLKTDRPGQVIVSESYFPGWKATIDGESATISLFENYFLSVNVPEGEHTVHFHYLPISFVIGLIISILTLVVFLWTIKKEFN